MADDADLMEFYFKNGYPYYMSLWDLSHLWHNKNSQHDEALDLDVQKTIMIFSRWIQRGEIDICNENSYTYSIKNLESSMRSTEEDFLNERYPDYDGSGFTEGMTKGFEEYCDYIARKKQKYYDFAGEVTEIFKTQNFNKKALKKVFLHCEEVEWFCEKSNMSLPEFWFPKTDNIETSKEIDVNIGNSTKLFKALLKVNKNSAYFGEDDMRNRDSTIDDIMNEYSIGKNAASAIYLILNPNKEGGLKNRGS